MMTENTELDLNNEFTQKIKDKNRKITVSFFIRLCVAFLLISIFAIYILTPLSSIKNMEIDGNIYLNKSDIYEILNKRENTSLYSIDVKEVDELLINHPLIAEAKVDINPFKMKVNIKEKAFAYQNEGKYYNIYNELIDDELINNKLISSYITKHGIELSTLPTLINYNENISTSYIYKYLYISTLVNKTSPFITYLEAENSQKCFTYYLKENSKSYYLRVKLYCNQDLNPNSYIDFLSKENMENFYSLIERDYDLLNMRLGDQNIDFYALKLIYNENKFILTGDAK